MPFIADLDDERVIPEQVDDGVDVWCTYCNGRMRPRGPMQDGRARHFFHVDNIGKAGGGGGGCEGGGEGESETHRKYKSFVVSKLKQLYPEFIDSCKPEQRLPADGQLPSGKHDRQADVLMLLDQPTETFGRGLIVEVQYRNLGKDVQDTTQDYVENGFSVLWVDEDDFESDRCLLTKKQIRSNVIPVWPNAVPDPMFWGEQRYKWWVNEIKDQTLTETKQKISSTYGVPAVEFIPKSQVIATLPDEFIDEIAQDIKREQDWDSLFSPPEDYTDIWCYAKVPATLPPEWHAQEARRLWSERPWHDRFWLDVHHHITYLDPHHWDAKGDIPIGYWIAQEPDDGWYTQILKAHYRYGAQGSSSVAKCTAPSPRDWCLGIDGDSIMNQCSACIQKYRAG